MLRILLRSGCSRVIDYRVLRQITSSESAKFDHGPSYYVIPEIPSESYSSQSLIQECSPTSIENLKPDETFGGFSRLLMNCQLSLSKLSERINKTGVSQQNEELINALEQILLPVDQAFSNIQNVYTLKDDPVWSIVAGRLCNKMESIKRDYFYLDPEIYEALCYLNRSVANLDTYSKGLLHIWLNECWIHGAEIASASKSPKSKSTVFDTGEQVKNAPISDKPSDNIMLSPQKAKKLYEELNEIRENLTMEESQFQAMVFASASVSGAHLYQSRFPKRISQSSGLTLLSGKGQIPVAESDLASSAPDWLPMVLGGQQNGGHIAGMHVNLASDQIVDLTLKHCSTREIREHIWRSWVQRASARAFGPSSGQHASNDNRMQTIRRLRSRFAKLLGCPDWLSVQWHSEYNHSPKSSDSLVNEILEPLRLQLEVPGKNELRMLREWASANLDLHGKILEPWDIDYAIEQYNYAATYSRMKSNIIPQNGSLLNYIHDIFHNLSELFQLRLVKQDGKSSGTNDALQIIYNVELMPEEEFLGQIIVDIFSRSDRPVLLGGNIAIPLVSRSHLSMNDDVHNHSKNGGRYPIAYLTSSFNSSVETQGIRVDDLVTIIANFGRCLQHVVCRVPHHQLSGFSSYLAADSRFFTSDLCAFLVLSNGIPQAKIETTTKSTDYYSQPTPIGLRPPSKHITALPLLRQLYESQFDLALWSAHSQQINWYQLHQDLWKSHLPYPLHEENFWPCSSVELFGSNSESGFKYQHVWRKLLLNDFISLLNNAGWSKEGPKSKQALDVLKNFRDTYLTLGASVPPAELYRRCSGRDPSIEHLLNSIETRAIPAESFIVLNNAAPDLVRH